MAIAKELMSWVTRMKADMIKKDFDEAVEIALFILEETGSHFRAVYSVSGIRDTKDMEKICREADKALVAVTNSVDVSTDLKEIVETERESLAIRYPFLPIDL